MTLNPLAEGIPTDQAWREGRRVYVRCAFNSRLNQQLRDLGAKWDRDVRALWVGTGKADKVLPLVKAAEDRKTAVAHVMAEATRHSRWISIPPAAAAIREQAKQLGAVWNPDTKLWALPTDEAAATVRAAATAYSAEVEAQRAADREARRQARAEDSRRAADREAEAAKTAAARTLASSGRTPTGETGTFTAISTEHMNRTTAEQRARHIGSVVKTNGKQAVITGRTIWFTNDDMASSVCWHPETHDEAHWDFRYEIAYVEPTADEIAADQEQAAQRADEAELAQVFEAVRRAPRTEAGEQEAWSPVTGPSIQRWGGRLTHFDDGRIVLDGNRAVYQHPGYYDDYRRNETSTDDPGLVARVRALIDRGARTIGAYTITIP